MNALTTFGNLIAGDRFAFVEGGFQYEKRDDGTAFPLSVNPHVTLTVDNAAWVLTDCAHDWQEQLGEPPVDACSSCGKLRW